MNSKSRHGYSKLLSFQFFNQIQYKYYRNNSLMYKEGISFDHSQCQDDNTSENLTFKYIIKYYPFLFCYINDTLQLRKSGTRRLW